MTTEVCPPVEVRPRRARLAVALAGLGALGAGCAGAPPAGPPPDPSELLLSLRAAASTRRSLGTEAAIEYFGDRRVRFRSVILVQRPRSFRVEVLSPFEEPLDVMVSDGEKIQWLSRDAFREGLATPENVARVLPIPLGPEALVDVMLGGVPRDAAWQPVRIDPARKPTSWKLTLRHPDESRLEVWVSDEDRSVLKARFADVTAEFEGFRPVSGRRVATRITIRTDDAQLRVRLEDPEVDQPYPEPLFHLPVPAGMTPRGLEP